MRILIDLQGAQTTGSRHRGIGRYSLSLTEGILRARSNHDVQILLNGAFPDSIADIRSRLGGLLDDRSFHLFYPVGETRQDVISNLDRRHASEFIREAVIASLKPDLVHVTSHFEGFGDRAISSFKRLETSAIQSVTLYDLIPYIHRDIYLKDAIPSRWYDERLLQLRRADLLLGISSSSAQEAIDYLGFHEENVVNVGTAADPQFVKRKITDDRASELCSQYGLRRRFVMYTGGIDHRKNIERLISAFARLGDARREVSLAIVCSCNDADRKRLGKLASERGLSAADVVLTGFVPEHDLVDLYNLCELFVFPSWHEGFGLPALEAMRCGAPVIGSDRSSLPEVIGLREALFDPFDESAIAGKIDLALTNKAFRSKLLANSRKQAKSFSWQSSAEKAIAAFEGAFERRSTASVATRIRTRPRLAYVSPIPPAKSGIADYSAELLPELSRHYEIDLIVPTEEHVPLTDGNLRNEFRVVSAESLLSDQERYDRVLYHVGNSDHHGHMTELVRAVPGVVVLHDFYLSGMLDCMENVHRVGPVFTEALVESHGFQPLMERSRGATVEQLLWKYPANRQIVERALGVIVHSEYSRRLADRWLGRNSAGQWNVIPLMRVQAQPFDRLLARSKVGVGNEFLICSFGGLGATKQSDRLLEAYLNTAACRSGRARLVFVGSVPQNPWGERITQRISEVGGDARVSVTGWASPETYRAYLKAADAAVQLRALSRGETSAAVLDCMNFAIPTIANANGSMADLPQDSVVMLEDDFANVELSRAVDMLFNNADLRARLRKNGQAEIKRRHNPRSCADQYRAAIESAYAGAAASPLFVARAISSIAPDLDEVSRTEAAKLLSGLFGQSYARTVFLDVSAIESVLSPADVDAAIRTTAERLLDANTRFEVIALSATGGFSTRRKEALRALGVSGITLGEYEGHLAAHDKVFLLIHGGAPDPRLVESLSNNFVAVEVRSVLERARQEIVDAVPELQ